MTTLAAEPSTSVLASFSKVIDDIENNEFETENFGKNESSIDPPGSKHLRQSKLKGIDCANTWKWLGESD